MSGDSVPKYSGDPSKGITTPLGNWLGGALSGGSDASFGSQLGHTIVDPGYDLLGQGRQGSINSLAGNPGNPMTANSQTPTLKNTTMVALQNQLNDEVRMRMGSTLQTGGTGLSDSPATKSAGQMLLGA